jgi:glycogen operon protein
MLLSGDEIGRTQGGNNNAYCQDNEISWLDWRLEAGQQDLLDFVCELIKLRKQHPGFSRQHFFFGRRLKGANVKDILWLHSQGQEMTDEEWAQSETRCLGMFMAGDAIEEYDSHGCRIVDDDNLLLFNANHEKIDFHLPPYLAEVFWKTVLDTSDSSFKEAQPLLHQCRTPYPLQGRSLAWLLAYKPNSARQNSKSPIINTAKRVGC